jgi:uncharacterized lipoprotein YmbA
MSAWRQWTALPLCAALAACASTKAPVLLTLPPATSGMAPSATVSGGATRVLALKRFEIPEYLAARRVRYRADASTLREWPNTYWAERLEVAVLREFSSALRERLPGWRLCETRCGEQLPTASLQLRLDRMDYLRSERRLQASMHFTLWRAGRSTGILRAEAHSYDIAGDGEADTPQSEARAISELLRRVAKDVALSLDAAP